ncbi:MAG: hypothetical protein RLZZ52_303 [Actinomycetota bacterium]
MKKKLQSATTLPLSPTDDSGWWLVVCAAGAIFLPYFAMIAANVRMAPKTNAVERPSTIMLYHEKSS